MPRAKNLVSSPSRARGFLSLARENLCSSATTDTDFLRGHRRDERRRTAPLFSRLQMFKKCMVNTTAEVLSELQDSDATVSTLIRQWNESASSLFLDRHFRHHGHPSTGRHHSQNGTELATFKDDIRL